jgi:uncharacterized metal-binding protein
MPNARTHDLITVATGVALGPIIYNLTTQTLDQPYSEALANTLWLVGAHMVSGLLFSPDLDIDSAIDNRWGFLYVLWRPYMWIIPHRHFWSHSLIFAPLLRLAYFYFMLIGMLLFGAWGLAQIGLVVPDYASRLSARIQAITADEPAKTLAFLIGFCTGSAAHTIADWSVTSGKRFLRMFGITVRRDYRNHDHYVPRRRRS